MEGVHGEHRREAAERLELRHLIRTDELAVDEDGLSGPHAVRGDDRSPGREELRRAAAAFDCT
jgi:hypothetical protein